MNGARLARPEDVLADGEQGREAEFIRLFREQLQVVTVDPRAPTVTEVVAARARAVAVWCFGRQADVAEFRRDRVDTALTVKLARREEFSDSDHRTRLRRAALDEIIMADDLLAMARGGELAPEAATTPNREKVR